MAKGTDVAVKKSASSVVMMDDFFASYADAGLEEVTTQDLSIPYLRILAQLSPQVNKRDGAYVDGAEAGMIYNTMENAVYNGDEGVTVVPCYFRRVLVEWKPREKGGGFVATYNIEDPIRGTTYRDDRGQEVLPNGNLLTDTAEFYVLLLGPDGPSRCMITMTSTQLKKARRWVSQMKSMTARREDGSIYTLPAMSHVWAMRSIQEKNDKGTWFGWDISKQYGLDPENKPEDRELFLMGLEFAKSVGAGDVKVKPDAGTSAKATSGSSRHDDDIPF